MRPGLSSITIRCSQLRVPKEMGVGLASTKTLAASPIHFREVSDAERQPQPSAASSVRLCQVPGQRPGRASFRFDGHNSHSVARRAPESTPSAHPSASGVFKPPRRLALSPAQLRLTAVPIDGAAPPELGGEETRMLAHDCGSGGRQLARSNKRSRHISRSRPTPWCPHSENQF